MRSSHGAARAAAAARGVVAVVAVVEQPGGEREEDAAAARGAAVARRPTGESKWKPPDAPYIPYAADPATDDRTPKTAAATIPAPRRSLSEPPFQGDLQVDLQTAPPTPVRDGAPPPPPADVDATPRTKLSAFLQTHAVQQQQ